MFLDKDDNKKKDIQEHHVVCLYSIMIALMLCGDPSIENMYNSRSQFDHCAPATKSMPQDCLQDLYQLLHFVDDWEIDDDDNWNKIYSHIKAEGVECTASH